MSQTTTLFLACALCCLPGLPVHGQGAEQTSWAGGAVEPGPLMSWTESFASQSGVSYRALPGRITLASEPLQEAIKHPITADFVNASALAAGDLDGDGTTDLVACSYSRGEIVWWRNDGGRPPGWTSYLVDSFPEAITVTTADVDGDGAIDVIAGAQQANEVAWWRNGGGDPVQWTRQTIDRYPAHQVYAAYIDDDEHIDLVAGSQAVDELVWWRNDGGDPITWQRQTIDDAFPVSSSVCAADIDGDRSTDVLAVSTDGSGGISWWRNEGGTPRRWTGYTVTSSFRVAHWVDTGDVDGDGDIDVLGAAFGAGRVSWWRNDGGDPIAWSEQVIARQFKGALTVRSADMDGDGDLDAVGAASGDDEVTWWENLEGDGGSWEPHVITDSYPGAWPVLAADLDNDGDLDLVASAELSGAIDWWEVSRFTAAGELTSSILDTVRPPLRARFTWRSVVPEGSSLRFMLRSSDDPADLGDWSQLLQESATLDGLHRYFQYRVLMTSEIPDTSPILDQVYLGVPGPRLPSRRVRPQ